MRKTWTAGLVAVAVLLPAAPARALITGQMPLDFLLKDATFITTAKVESVDADRPALVLTAGDDLKGRLPLRRLAVLMRGDAEARKRNHVPQLLRRLAPDLPVVLFVIQKDKRYTAFAYSNGTWFQIAGAEVDGAVRWQLTHGEPYLRKTFKGSTAELKQTVIDCLAGKRKSPEPDNREKPGFGPEAGREKKEEKKDDRPASAGGPLLGVIPTVLIGGPVALLAMLFPAVFGGLMLVLRRWLAALTVLSLNSTLYVLQDLCRRWLLASWWGTPQALWLTMTVITLLGLLWAWRRHVGEMQRRAGGVIPRSASPGADAPGSPGRTELITLSVLSLVCLGLSAWSLSRAGLAQLDLPGRMLLMFGAGLWAATLHALWRLRAARPGLPGEGVLLWTMLLAGVGLAALARNETAAAGVADDEAAPAGGGWRQRVAWRFRPNVERCWMASSPAADGDRVYVGAVLPGALPSGAVICADRRTGEPLWTFNDGGDMKPVFSSPCLADGRLYVGEGFHQDSQCKLYCLDAATGRKLWACATGSHTESSPCAARGKVWFGAGDDGLYCLDAATGQEKWHFTERHVDANPLVIDNRLYAGSGAGDQYQTTELFCLDADSGAVHWRVPVDLPAWGQPVVQGEYLYAALGNGNFEESAEKPAGAVLCLERATGRRVWRYDVPDGVLGRVCADEDRVWFAARDRHAYCLDRRDGRRLWKKDLGSPVVASPWLAGRGADAGLYVLGSEGLLTRLDPRTGDVVWAFDVTRDAGQPATAFSSPRVRERAGRGGESRLIWFGCGLGGDRTHGLLYCLEETRSPDAAP